MRKQFITHPEFQRPFIASFILGTIIIYCAFLLFSFGCYFFIQSDPTVPILVKETFRIEMFDLFWLATAIVSILSIGVGYLGLYMSHKMMGLLNRIETWITRFMENPEHVSIQYRKGDSLIRIVHSLARIMSNRF
ncbi:MAG: hypothetical protein ACKVQC_01010 [Elusimicrobiota bacterium]